MKKTLVLMLMALVLINIVSAAGISSQLKRTNPGIAGKRPATMIFDVVNTDTDHYLQAFLLCNSPDDVQVTSSMGAGTGAAQYVSPLFFMEKGPSQEALTISLEADTAGDKHTGCFVKYIPYKEKVAGTTEKTEDFTKETSVDYGLGKNVEGFVVTYKTYTAAVTDDAETTDVVETAEAKAEIDIDGTKKTIEVGKEDTIGTLKVEVISADDEKATLKVTGKKTVTKTGETIKIYQKMNGEETTEVEDNQYRVLRLDKTMPFAEDMSDPQCPKGETSCNADELVDNGYDVSKILWGIGILVGLLAVAYLIGRTR